jgi:hypothetical protein
MTSRMNNEDVVLDYYQQIERIRSKKSRGQQLLEWLLDPFLSWWFAPMKFRKYPYH